MEPLRPPSWNDFHAVGEGTAPTRSKLTDYVWIILGAAIAGWLIGGLFYIGFEFWRYGPDHHAYHPLKDMANTALANETNEMGMNRIWISAWIGSGVGGFIGLMYMLWCFADESARERAAKLREARGGRNQLK